MNIKQILKSMKSHTQCTVTGGKEGYIEFYRWNYNIYDIKDCLEYLGLTFIDCDHYKNEESIIVYYK